MGAARKKSWTGSLRRAAPRLMGVAMALDLLAVPGTAAVLRPEGAEEVPPVRWLRPEGPQRSELDRWRAAVGPAQVWTPPPAPTAGVEIDAFHVVVWNTHVGAGSIERLIADLRRGALTGGVPVEHFALLLQEVYRGGETVPATPPPGSRSARAIRPGASRRGIDEVARRTALHAYYVPSMRNGARGRRSRRSRERHPRHAAARQPHGASSSRSSGSVASRSPPMSPEPRPQERPGGSNW